MSNDILTRNGIIITKDADMWHELSIRYNIEPQEVGLIDLNRTGVRLIEKEVRVGFRTRFNGSIFYNDDLSWYALPVRGAEDSHFYVKDGVMLFNGCEIGKVDHPLLDTCNTSYQRGPRLLNLNSRSRSSCGGCKACVHNDKTLYDDTVIKDRSELITREDITKFFEQRISLGLDVTKLEQIAVVTGLFRDEEDTLEHLSLVSKVANEYGFCGELMYFGCQLMSPQALRAFSSLGNCAIVFAIDNFSKREINLSRIKSKYSLDNYRQAMSTACSLGIATSFAYIVGVDSLAELKRGFELFKPVSSRFPVANIFQIQTDLQALALDKEARTLEYYVQARRIIENIFGDTEKRPRRWENYRPLWYRTFNNEPLDVKSYG